MRKFTATLRASGCERGVLLSDIFGDVLAWMETGHLSAKAPCPCLGAFWILSAHPRLRTAGPFRTLGTGHPAAVAHRSAQWHHLQRPTPVCGAEFEHPRPRSTCVPKRDVGMSPYSSCESARQVPRNKLGRHVEVASSSLISFGSVSLLYIPKGMLTWQAKGLEDTQSYNCALDRGATA